MKQVRPRLTAREQVFISELRGKECGYRPRLYLDEVEELIKFRDIENTRSERMPKVLLFDIETSPLKAYVWGRWKQNIHLGQTLSEWFMLTWSAKWLGKESVYGDAVTSKEVLLEDDSRIAKSLWELIDEADFIIGHNCIGFDTPKMNTRFIMAGLPQPSPYTQIDTLKTARSQFGFSSNKLDALCGYFNIEHKDDTNFQLWVDCLSGKQDALDYMLKYNKKDVTILEEVYMKLRPWIKNHPNTALYLEEDVPVCHVCGSRDLVYDNSYKYTSVSKFPVLRCLECESLSRQRTTAMPLDKRKVLLTSV